MIQLPIGENFEDFVRWLKKSFSGFFDSISEVLDFSITGLENTLLLNSETLYASVLFGVLLAIVVGMLGRRSIGKRTFLPFALGTLLVFGIAENWRLKSLSEEVTPEVAERMMADFTALNEALQAAAPDDLSPAIEALEGVIADLPDDIDRSSGLFAFRRSLQRGVRNLGRSRSNDYRQATSALEDSLEVLANAETAFDGESLRALREARDQFYALTLVEQINRINRDLGNVSEGDQFGRKIDFMNARTYNRIVDMINTAAAFHADNAAVAEPLAVAEANVRTLNPDRLGWYTPLATILLLALTALFITGSGMALFTVFGFLLAISMNMWTPTVETLALVLSATLFALILGVPIGVLAAGSQAVERGIRPILDFMQTMPAFVYLIPAVIFFGLGKVPGAMATLIFAMPPAVRLTSLGIRQVPTEVVEAAQAFGATRAQMLFKAQLPIAMPTILAGVNQTIMLALSMVVIGGMIGAGGLGEVVLGGITRMNLGVGFEGGIAVVVLAIYLDRVTQALGTPKAKKRK